MLEEQTIGYLVGELGGPGSLSEEIVKCTRKGTT